MVHAVSLESRILCCLFACLAALAAGSLVAATTAEEILKSVDRHGGLIVIRAVGIADGRLLWEKEFGPKLAFNALAVDAGGIIASFDDGSVACLR